MRSDGNGDSFFAHMRGRAGEMLQGNTAWRERAEVIEFEQLNSAAAFRTTFERVFTYLGANPEVYDWDGGWALCKHKLAFGRWERDPEVLGFMQWLQPRDEQLHRRLASGSPYLD
jgi:hypothetical protein